MKKIYVVMLWGYPQAFYSTKEEARKAGKALKEPTNDDGEYEYGEFSIEEWIEGKDTQKAKTFSYEYKIGKTKD